MNKPSLGSLMSIRCQHNSHDDFYQCGLIEGHGGDHKTSFQIREERERNRSPTLDDIRRVVREEIKAALADGERHGA